MSNIVSFNINSLSIFSSFFVLVNFVVLQEYYADDKKFIIMLIIMGLFIDIVYNGTALVSSFIFVLIFYINKGLNYFLPYNLLTVNLFSIFSIIVYNIITFLILVIIRFDRFSFMVLLKVIGCNLIMTVIYASIIYSVTKYFVRKLDLKVIR